MVAVAITASGIAINCDSEQENGEVQYTTIQVRDDEYWSECEVDTAEFREFLIKQAKKFRRLANKQASELDIECANSCVREGKIHRIRLKNV